MQFYFMTLGSLVEIQNQLLIAKDPGYVITKEKFNFVAKQIIVVNKFINAYNT